MTSGIGVDLLSVERIRPLISNPEDPFFRKTYTEKEREEASRSNQPLYYYAGRFAAKEAVIKALHIDDSTTRLNQIETLNDDTGAPFVKLYGSLEKACIKSGIRKLHISISYEPPLTIAFAVCEKG